MRERKLKKILSLQSNEYGVCVCEGERETKKGNGWRRRERSKILLLILLHFFYCRWLTSLFMLSKYHHRCCLIDDSILFFKMKDTEHLLGIREERYIKLPHTFRG